MPAPPTTAAELLRLIRKSGIVSRDRVAAVPAAAALPAEPRPAAAELVARGVITPFQARQLLLGRHKGFHLGPHVVLDQLGRGGMGAVYLAEHRDLHRKVAIKVLVAAKDDDQKLAAERFLREARAAAALDHPNIVRVFDASRHGSVPFLVMEYVNGPTLQHTLDRTGPLPPATAADVVAQAAAGLQHAHEMGFVHRDVKPANLIRDRSGVVKILDMGLARKYAAADHPLDAAAVGTADYISPEQALNDPRVDVRADVYSLGATFFALLTGRPPFEGSTVQKLLHHQLKSPPPLSKIDPTLPPGLVAVVAKMLAKRPADRYQTPAEVIAALAPWLGNSARVLAGLSRTSLVHHQTGLNATLHEIATGGSSSRLTATGTRPARTPADSGEVDPAGAAAEWGLPETGAVAAAETTRTPTQPPARRKTRPPVHSRGWKRAALLAAAALGLLAAGMGLGRLAYGG